MFDRLNTLYFHGCFQKIGSPIYASLLNENIDELCEEILETYVGRTLKGARRIRRGFTSENTCYTTFICNCTSREANNVLSSVESKLANIQALVSLVLSYSGRYYDNACRWKSPQLELTNKITEKIKELFPYEFPSLSHISGVTSS